MNYYILIAAIVLEVLIRFIPTKFNLSILDNVKLVMLQLHTLIDIVLPNNKIEDVQ